MTAVKNGFSVTGHKQTLTLDWKSIIKKCDDFSGPVNGFVFADFNSIIEQKCPRDSFFDVIGQIVSFRPLETRNRNPSRHYIKMTISNLQYVHLNVTIFGSQAHQMSQYLKSNTTVTCVVIVMQLVKLNVWDGIGQAQSHFDELVKPKVYTVVKLTEDVSIVSELESKLELMSVQSVSLNELPLESDDVIQNVQKDVISQTDESFTPSTADKSTATSPMKIYGDLKRNLHDVYDVDGGGDLSSTKSKRLSMGDGNPLLVPKVEK
uniref:Replication protein A OB domain-containing protein n=1 Tax=Lactuca sativa TaxID=4236 RepID=A0A9R1WIF5_LACSA|nr:hypothetical protein LSAT_V11C100049780 [Lactuca sativa]